MNLFHRSVKNFYTFKFWLLDLLDWNKGFEGLTGPISCTMILKWADCVWPFLFSYYFLCMYWVPCQFLIPGKWASRGLITTGPRSLYSPYRMPREWFTGEMERVKRYDPSTGSKWPVYSFAWRAGYESITSPVICWSEWTVFESTFW